MRPYNNDNMALHNWWLLTRPGSPIWVGKPKTPGYQKFYIRVLKTPEAIAMNALRRNGGNLTKATRHVGHIVKALCYSHEARVAKGEAGPSVERLGSGLQLAREVLGYLKDIPK